MIRHSVIFSLKYPKDSAAEKEFLDATLGLKDIPGVHKFEQLLQVSPKNKFSFGLSMEFASQNDYDNYNNHPLHSSFIEQYWLKGVEDFLEIDFTLLDTSA